MPPGTLPVCPTLYAAFTSEVQWEQRVALMGIGDRQYRHSLVVGAAGPNSGFRAIRLTCRTMRKIANATMMKSITVLANIP